MWPAANCASVLRSFETHSEYSRRAAQGLVCPNARERLQLKAWFALRNPAKYPPREAVIPQENKAWLRAASGLNWSGSTGLGAFASYNSIGDALGWDGFRITNQPSWEVLKHLTTLRLRNLQAETPCRCREANCPSCPTDIKYMIKMEPHKHAKIDQHRERLISVLSLVDQMVDRVLFGTYVAYEKEHVMERAGKTGWSPVPCGFYDLLDTFSTHVLATDCSAFDWTYPSWVPELIWEVKFQQTSSYAPTFKTAIFNRLAEVLGPDCLVRLPNGTRLKQTIWGLMKSGWLLTINMNSDAQDIITTLAWSRAYPERGQCPLLWSMGDDVIMRWRDDLDPEPLVRELGRAGILSKFAVPSREFAGFLVGRDDRGRPYVDPLYPEKHKYLLAHTSEDKLEDVVTAYGLIYALARPEARAWLEPYLVHSRWTRDTYLAWAYGLLGGATLALSGDAGGHFTLG